MPATASPDSRADLPADPTEPREASCTRVRRTLGRLAGAPSHDRAVRRMTFARPILGAVGAVLYLLFVLRGCAAQSFPLGQRTSVA